MLRSKLEEKACTFVFRIHSMDSCLSGIGILERESEWLSSRFVRSWQRADHVLLPIHVCRISSASLNCSACISSRGFGVTIEERNSVGLVRR